MSPDDPRHGREAGYVAGCRQQCCSDARYRIEKWRDLQRLAGHVFQRSAEDLDDLMGTWENMGIGRSVVTTAAGLASQWAPRGAVLTSTYDALAAVTEDDLPGNALCFADLTRRRVFSLQAAGHPMSALPVLKTGRWRYSPHCSISLARQVRSVFQELEFTPGPSKHVASCARNRGYVPPLGWDDPGTLAWPRGWVDDADRSPVIDQVLVDRVVDGQYHLIRQATRLERIVICDRFRELGLALRPLELAGIDSRRYRGDAA